MTLNTIVTWIIVGGVAGLLAEWLIGGIRAGCIGTVIIGILGAFIGGWLLGQLGISLGIENSLLSEIVTAFIGAAVLLLIVRLVRRA
jgi:uncharacterized membrane protein YeaQ/YmgE (transglycosylase-associated protein family)